MGIDRVDITGLVLAGGRGSRMGGVDKGLQLLEGRPLALHAALRLAPQVGRVLVNANRHAEAYAAFGLPVVADARSDYAGPLAGMQAALEHCETRWLATVPCDTPRFPADLVALLARALSTQGGEIAMATTRGPDGTLQAQPVFCLIDIALRDRLTAGLHGGERRVDRWAAQQRLVQVVFDDADAFFNANTAAELEQLRAPGA